jgi:hypothetical protein
MMILPRQARDKHRESTQKRCRFVAGNYAKVLTEPAFLNASLATAHAMLDRDTVRKTPGKRRKNAEKRLSLLSLVSTFAMFVPSLCWQNDRFYI